ncbi:MAG TPA: tannase/feruloyl esterase family alpha/beta hydrolase [Thermoleophilaceae bacterium]
MRLVLRRVVFVVVILTAAGVAAVGGSAVARSGPAAKGAVKAHAGDLPVIAPTGTCAQFATTDVSEAVGASVGITSATAGTAPQGYSICDIKGVIAPQIQFEVTLPTQTYSGRYLQTGCGGLCGTLAINAQAANGCAPLTSGAFAMASDNMGHVAGGNNDGNFGTDPQLRLDFAYRADHLLALTAKELIKRFYGSGPKYSYFDGCSEGGHEALEEVQRFPHDFNGVIAGAPASILQPLNTFYQPWLAKADFDSSGNQIMPASKLPLVHNAALANCDGKDGLVDGQIDDPRACTFDPGSLACPSDQDAATCLTQAQIAVVRKIYSGPVDQHGKHLYPGGEPVGSELAWSPWFIPPAPNGAQQSTISWSIGNGWLKYLAYNPNPPLSFDVNQATFDDQTFERASKLFDFWDATNPNLSAFRKAGGKLIIWQGWADQAISPYGTVAYYAALQDQMGGLAATQKFARLFMFPGVLHCAGGNAGGPNTFDLLTPLLSWVEQGTAPSQVIASASANGQVTRTRPVYPYPLVARYNGTGDTNDAANFHPVAGPKSGDRFQWLGSFKPVPRTHADRKGHQKHKAKKHRRRRGHRDKS